MYELYILGQLLYADRSAYKLRFILENILGANRKVSFGVLYPLLEKMETAGTLMIIEDLDWRGKKKIHVTAAGRDRFLELMREPVKHNAHMDDIYLFKLNSLSLVDNNLAKKIMMDFREKKQAQRDRYTENISRLTLNHADAPFFKSALQANKLQVVLANTYLDYVDMIESELE
ncbi:PadR family transcriptional regulator [Leuconostoc citreum]|uniref:PadR family transcriptional regulator n=1 Tax=Leuconostoc citreum TaxID=33964 RepID=UPI00112077A4|nr:PadR family transcriptional regulator [Leuconostoc citreum]TOY70428.1 transcriptional regulator [Leuconostoc citreum]